MNNNNVLWDLKDKIHTKQHVKSREGNIVKVYQGPYSVWKGVTELIYFTF